MVTDTKKAQDTVLEWDHFLAEYGNPSDRPHIERFMAQDWTNIRRELWKSYNWYVNEDIHLHWVASGRAVLWQSETRREIQTEGEERKWVEVRGEWSPVSPLLLNNASTIAHYLEKGFRLRPPLNGVEVDVERDVEFASPSEAQSNSDELTFRCFRHEGAKNYKFPTWDAYIAHCDHYNEYPEASPPPEVTERASQFQFYCYQHNFGTDKKRLMDMHVRESGRNIRQRGHVPTNKMKINQEKG